MRTLRSLIAVLFIAVLAASCTVVVTPAVAPDAPTVTVTSTGVASTVTLAAVTSGSFVYYTTDGTTPTISSALYSSPFVVAGYGVTKTVKAIAYASGLYSTEVSKTVTVGSTLSLAGTASNFATSLSQPWGIASDGTNMYVSDNAANLIYKIVISSGSKTVLAGSGLAGSGDGTGTLASFNGPAGLATDGANLYVADSGNNLIRKIVISTGVVSTFAGSGAAAFVNGTGAAASFYQPIGLATDGESLYVSEYGNHAIRKIVLSSAVVSTLAGTGSAGSSNGTGTSASFNHPYNLTTDGANLYVADNGNNYVRKVVISSGVVENAFYFSSIVSLATDGSSLFVTDYNDGEVWKYAIGATTATGQVIYGLSHPMGIATDGAYLYVADTGYNRVVVI
jgi:hypothetical protein